MKNIPVQYVCVENKIFTYFYHNILNSLGPRNIKNTGVFCRRQKDKTYLKKVLVSDQVSQTGYGAGQGPAVRLPRPGKNTKTGAFFGIEKTIRPRRDESIYLKKRRIRSKNDGFHNFVALFVTFATKGTCFFHSHAGFACYTMGGLPGAQRPGGKVFLTKSLHDEASRKDSAE